MQISWRKHAVAVSVLCTVAAYPVAASAAPLHFLMVGSSHTWGIKKPLRRIYRSYGIGTTFNTIAPIRGSLLGDAKEALLAIRNGPDPDVAGDHFDYVILQENGGLIDQVNWVASVALRNAAVQHGGRAIFFMTFPTERDFKSSAYNIVLDRLIDGPCAVPSCPPIGTPPGCCRGYATLAHATELNMRVAPVGQSVVDFHLDPAHVVHEIYGPDGRHLNAKGKYLAALTIFATIERTLPGSLWQPAALAADGVDYKRIVRAAVFGPPSGTPRLWNLYSNN